MLNIGYSRPELIEAVKKQSERYFHGMFNIVTHEGYVALAEKLNTIAPVKGTKRKTYFANSGAEADENAVKIAKAFTKRPNIIVFSGAFHGRTMLTMAMTSKKAYAYGMGPFPDGVYRAEFPYLYRKLEGIPETEAISYYIKSIEQVFEQASPAEFVAAIVVEPLQGEGGFVPAPIEWVKAVRNADAQPDIVTTAKSIAGGIPLSAITAREEIMEAVPCGVIGGTFCGNPLACASALQVIEIMEKENFEARAVEIGKKVMKRYQKMQKKLPVIGDVRGIGAMIGLEIVKDQESKQPNPTLVSEVVQECIQNGLIIENAGIYGNVIRFLAPLVITDEQLEAGLDILEAAIRRCM